MLSNSTVVYNPTTLYGCIPCHADVIAKVTVLESDEGPEDPVVPEPVWPAEGVVLDVAAGSVAELPPVLPPPPPHAAKTTLSSRSTAIIPYDIGNYRD